MPAPAQRVEELFEDAEIDGLPRRSWWGGFFTGVVFGCLGAGVVLVALSLSQPLPENLPGVGSVEVVDARDAVEDVAQPATSAPETPAAAPTEKAEVTEPREREADSQAGQPPSTMETGAAETPATPEPQIAGTPVTPEPVPAQPTAAPETETSPSVTTPDAPAEGPLAPVAAPLGETIAVAPSEDVPAAAEQSSPETATGAAAEDPSAPVGVPSTEPAADAPAEDAPAPDEAPAPETAADTPDAETPPPAAAPVTQTTADNLAQATPELVETPVTAEADGDAPDAGPAEAPAPDQESEAAAAPSATEEIVAAEVPAAQPEVAAVPDPAVPSSTVPDTQMSETSEAPSTEDPAPETPDAQIAAVEQEQETPKTATPDEPPAPTPQPSATDDEAAPAPPSGETDVAAVSTDTAPVEIVLAGPAFAVNARAFEAPEARPLLAVVLEDSGGNGVSPDVLAQMTMPLSFAVRPDREGARAFAEAARAAGHEVLAHLPLVALDGNPDSPTPYTRAGNDAALAEETRRALAKLNLAIGATAPENAEALLDQRRLRAILAPLGEYGFAYLDLRRGIGSPARRIASAQGFPYTESNRQARSGAGEDQIYQMLDAAAFQARRGGTSVLTVAATEAALKAVVRWAEARAGGQVSLAPLSAVIDRRN